MNDVFASLFEPGPNFNAVIIPENFEGVNVTAPLE